MKKRFLKFIDTVLILMLCMSNCFVAFATNGKEILETVSHYSINPVFEGKIDEPISSAFSYGNRYFAVGDVSESDYEASLEVLSEDVRQSLKNHEAVFSIYYKSETEFDNQGIALEALNKQILELAFVESDDWTEGDYLRYSWKSYGSKAEGYSYQGENIYYYTITYNFEYFISYEQEEEFSLKVEEVLNSFAFDNTTDDREKIDKIYNYITKNVRYDYDNLNDKDYTLKFTAYAALIDKTAVCEGYATLFYRMAEMSGVDSRVITGWGNGNPHPTDEFDIPDHAWNIAKLGDYYYYLDSTWDEGEVPATNFYLKGKNDFPNHTNEPRFENEEFKEKYPISNYGIDVVSFTGTIKEGDFTYEVNNGIAKVSKYSGTDANVVVPSKTNDGYIVKSIGFEAFYSNHTMKTLTLSEGIASLEGTAISYCHELETINYPSTLNIEYEHLGLSVLGGYYELPLSCSKLKNINVASNSKNLKVDNGVLYTYDMKTLLQCPSKYEETTLVIPDGVETITSHAVEDCLNIQKVVMPDTVNFIGYWAFSCARNLKDINISNKCEFIGQFALDSTLVEKLHIPASLREIMSAAFGDTLLKEITADVGGTYYLENGALRSDTNVVRVITDETSYTLSEGIININQYAFLGLENLEKIILPQSTKFIEPYAFKDCKSLVYLEIPENVEKLYGHANFGCDNLASIMILGDSTVILEELNKFNDGFTLYCNENSLAYEYALENNIKTKAISQFICVDGHKLQRVTEDDGLCYRMTCSVCGDKSAIVRPYSIYNADAELLPYNPEYTGEEIRPQIKSVKYGDVELIENVDYIIKGYEDNITIGNAYVIIEGIGEWGGIKKIPFNISEIDIANIQMELEYETCEYDGSSKEPKVIIEGLTEGVDYTVRYYSNMYPGKASVEISGKGFYWNRKILYFDIEKCDISKREFELSTTSVVYTGSNITLDVRLDNLYYNTDYIVEYKNNTNVGTATVIITGQNYYEGTIVRTFQITPADISDVYVWLEYTITNYDNTEKRPYVQLDYGRYILGTDYEVEYSNNINIGTANVTIKGIGNYKGTIQKTFEITQTDLEIFSSKVQLEYNQIDYSGESNKPKVIIEGLTEGVDYTLSYGQNINSGMGYVEIYGKGNYKGYVGKTFTINKLDISNLEIKLEYDTTIYNGSSKMPKVLVEGLTLYTDYTVTYEGDNLNVGTAYAVINGHGNYQGSVVKEYEITKASIEDFNVSIETEFDYTGHEITPTIFINGLSDDNYDVEYFDNINVGQGTVIITGKGNYKGTIIKTFSIIKRNISSVEDYVWLSFDEISYWGQANEPIITILGLTLGTDFTVEYKNNINAGTADVIITGIGVYDGTITKHFEINKMDIAYVNINIDQTDVEYTGSEITPEITVDGLTFGIDYDIKYVNNVAVGGASIILTGKGNYCGTAELYFNITPANISNKAISLEYTKALYDGEEKCPIVNIEGLNEHIDFEVSYSDNIEVGIATVTITGLGNYAGIVYSQFEIINPNLPAPENVTLSLYGHDDIEIKWSEVAGADGYCVYYKSSSSSSYVLGGDINTTNYKLSNLADNKKYTIRVVAYFIDENYRVWESENYKSASIYTLRNLSAPKTVSLSLYGYDDVKVKWSKVSYAKGYYVYYKNSSTSNYTYLGRTTETYYKKSNLSDGVKYYFRVVPYGMSDDDRVLSDNAKSASIYTLKKISTPSVKKYNSKKVKVKWTNISGESGYQISQSTSKSKTNIVSTYFTTSGKSKTITAKKGKTYYYKVRAYKTVSGKKIYGPWSSVKSYKLK